jgi:hypothetical protein
MSLSLPRPILLALVGLVAISAAFVATRGKKDATPAPSSSPTATLAAPSKLDAKSKRDTPAKKADRSAAGVNTPAKPASKVDAASITGLPRRVAHAIAKRRVVVLFFTQRGPADDTATRASVRALKEQQGKVSVFSDRIRNLSRYHRLVGELGVAGAPAVVIVGRDLKARLIEGFVDKDSLLQQVKDARR